MTKTELKKNVDSLKCFIDQQYYWMMQSNEMLHQLQEMLFDMEDWEYEEKYKTGSIKFLKEAATKNFDCPPRQEDSHCADDNTGAFGFYQSDFDLKKIV